MSYRVVSCFRALAVTSMVALLVSSQAMAESRPEVVERIKPIGMVTVEGGAKAASEATSAPAAAPVAAQAADPAAAVYLAKGCSACHGAEGKAPIMPTYPKVSSLPAKYIVNQLKDIKSGARANGQSAAMRGIMAAVTDEDMVNIADYLSAIPRSGSAPAAKPIAKAAPAAVAAPAAAPAPANPGGALYVAKGCNACHGAEGKAPIMPMYPKVSSLPAKYIVNQLKDIKSGARANGQSAVMKGIMAAVSEDDMAKIADYLSAIPR